MTASLTHPETVKSEIKENILTPRFYTTDFEKAATMDMSLEQDALETMLHEMRADYNRHHFFRDESFQQDWSHLQGEERQAFIDYLERSCVSEFSGFLLFKELSRKLKQKNSLLAEIFHLMARDEARHAGFLNKCMADFQIMLDLQSLTKKRTYTFFPVEWIIYAVYLSEKIGYWRYIIIYRHLEKYPEHNFYPLFNYFESWCQDENRHGDIFKALLRSQPKMWKSWQGRLWSRFFLLTVFATHALTVHERAGFYHSLGLDPTEFDQRVIQETNATAGRAFPVCLNVDHPDFYRRLQVCNDHNQAMAAIDGQGGPRWWRRLQKLPHQGAIAGHLLALYLLHPINTENLRGTVR